MSAGTVIEVDGFATQINYIFGYRTGWTKTSVTKEEQKFEADIAFVAGNDMI